MKKLLPLILFLLIGCTTMNSKFDCPNRPGVMCRSLDQVNTMVDRGEVGSDTATSGQVTMKKFPLTAVPNSPTRAGESVLRIWVAPYQDAQGNYHEQSALYTVLRPSHWQAPEEAK